jgi:hypothetical protein
MAEMSRFEPTLGWFSDFLDLWRKPFPRQIDLPVDLPLGVSLAAF